MFNLGLLTVLASLFARMPVLYGDEVTLNDIDFINAQLLPEAVGGKEDPLTEGMFEGDIHLNGRTIEDYIGGCPNDPLRQCNAVKSIHKLWPNAQIPYTVSSKFSSYERSRIAAAIQEYNEKTCIRFVPRTKQRDYVYMLKDGGCYSMVGRVGGRQSLSLGSGCVTKGIIMHEMMHATGFFHEQSRNDRDQYITLNTKNMMPNTESQFRKYSLSTITHLGTAYDYGSIMHYGKYAFSKNRLPTIVPKQRGAIIGQRVRLSPIDIQKLNILYKCPGSGGVIATTPKPKRTTTSRRPFLGRSTTSAPSGSCQDERSDCYWWRGSCDSAYIKGVCKKTCNVCTSTGGGGGGGTKCMDSTAYGKFCSGFKAKNYCMEGGSTGSFMRRHCCATCGF